MEECTKCKTMKPVAEFGKRGKYLCLKCCSEYAKAKRLLNPEAARIKERRQYDCRSPDVIKRKSVESKAWKKNHPDKVRGHVLKTLYGMDEIDYECLLFSQKGKCAICGTTDSGKRRFVVDHCHKTGAIRGLLCNKCNAGIGMLGDSVPILEAAITYLRNGTP